MSSLYEKRGIFYYQGKDEDGNRITVEEWIEEMNTCDRLHQYVKKRWAESEKRQGLSRPQN